MTAKPDAFAQLNLDLAARRLGHARRHPAPNATPLPTDGIAREGPSRVCIATSDLIGPVKNGGVGTACTALAEALSAAGDDVTIVFVGPFETGDLEHWRGYYARKGVTFAVPDSPPFPLEGPDHARASFLAYTWLKQQARFDVIHFPEINGVGFYALTAKRLGLAFSTTCLAVTLHSPTLWHRLENHEAVVDTEDLVLDFMERQCVADADLLISPTRYLLCWAADWGFQLPPRVHVQPNLTRVTEAFRRSPSGLPEELVFFGRLETRKGLQLFCDALERLAGSGHLANTRVTFLGKVGRVGAEDGATYAFRRSALAGLDVRVETGLDQDGALEYLRRAPVLAVMPSLADNLPYTVMECLTEGIPFISTTVGGIPECIHPDDRSEVLCDAEATALAALIVQRLHDPLRAVRPAVDAEANRKQWLAWHRQLAIDDAPRPSPPDPPDPPLVSVCIATRNRPDQLRTALASVLKQSYQPVEVVLVDDASDSEQALALLDTLVSEFGPKGWQVLRADTQKGPGAARNRAAMCARGDFLLFMDDDNIARPEEIETFVRAARHSGIPLLTCIVDHFENSSQTGPDCRTSRRWLPLGGALVPGLFSNQFGDTNFFVTRELFLELGGFDEDRAATFVEDWLFLSRAALRGVTMAVVPESLFWYRVWPAAHGQGRPAAQTLFRRLRPYLYSQPADRRALTMLAAGAHDQATARAAVEHMASARAAGLSARFEKAAVWLRIGAGDAAHLRAERELEISAASDGILLQATGHDPIAWLPGTVPRGLHSIARIDIAVPQDTCVQVFWSTRAIPYPCEEQSVLAPVRTGRHIVWVEIPAATHVGCLRFDPGFAPGAYVLHSIEIRSEGMPLRPSEAANASAAWPSLRFAVERLRRALGTLLWRRR